MLLRTVILAVRVKSHFIISVNFLDVFVTF